MDKRKLKHNDSTVWCMNDKRRKHLLMTTFSIKKEKRFFGLIIKETKKTYDACCFCHYIKLNRINIVKKWWFQ